MRKIFKTKAKINSLIKNQQGLSLTEMIVAVTIMGLLMGTIALLVIRTLSTNRHAIEQGLNVSVIQGVLRNISSNLRSAQQSDNGGYLISYADDFELIFYANSDDDEAVERFRYYLEDNQLKLGLAEATGFPLSYPSADDETRIVGNGIVNDASQPIFYYYNQDYPQDTANNPLSTPAIPGEIGLVQIDILVDTDPTQTPGPARMGTFIHPRNIQAED